MWKKEIDYKSEISGPEHKTEQSTTKTTGEKISETKRCFFLKIDKIDKPLDRLKRKRREKR